MKRIEDAIRIGADYCIEVLLDERGRSRCDYNVNQGVWELYEPCWHTGQIIYALVEAYKILKDPKYLRGAERGASYISSLRMEEPSSLKGMLKAIHMGGVPYINMTTITDGSTGLIRLYEITRERRWLNILVEAGDWMIKNLWIPDERLFYDMVDPKTGEPITEFSVWSKRKNPKITEVARPNVEGALYYHLWRHTKNRKYKEIFLESIERVLEDQSEDGLWMDYHPNDRARGSVHARFNLWYAEALCDAYELTRDGRYIEAAARTAKRYQKFQEPDGTIWYRNYVNGRKDRSSPCGSAVAFAGILWLRLLKTGLFKGEFEGNVELAVEWVIKNQFPADHPDPNLRGCFFEFWVKRKAGKFNIYQRDIATSFSIRFLADYLRWKGMDEK